MSDSAEDLAQRLVDINAELEETRQAKFDAETDSQYEEIITYRAGLLADRQAVIEQLESLGLEDPDL